MDAITSRPARFAAASARPDLTARPLADWPLATRSIFAFWLVYGATVVARALLSGDAVGVIQNRSVTILSGLLLTFGIYLAIALIGRRRAIRTKVGIAVAASILVFADRYSANISSRDANRYFGSLVRCLKNS